MKFNNFEIFVIDEKTCLNPDNNETTHALIRIKLGDYKFTKSDKILIKGIIQKSVLDFSKDFNITLTFTQCGLNDKQLLFYAGIVIDIMVENPLYRFIIYSMPLEDKIKHLVNMIESEVLR